MTVEVRQSTSRSRPTFPLRAELRSSLGRYAPSAILAGYGLFILSLYFRNVMTLYINPAYVPYTVAAGVVLLVLALARLPAGARARDASCDGCDCDAPPRLWPYLALCIPLVLAAVFPPRSLAAFSARERGPQIAGLAVIRGAAVKHVSLSVDTASFGLEDWAGALSADPNPRDYMGKAVDVTGMVLHDPASMPAGYIMVMRYQVTCCIADARPVGLIVRDTSRGSLKDNQWVRVVGTMGQTSYQGQSVAVVVPKQLAPTKAGDPYMY